MTSDSRNCSANRVMPTRELYSPGSHAKQSGFPQLWILQFFFVIRS